MNPFSESFRFAARKQGPWMDLPLEQLVEQEVHHVGLTLR